VSPIASSCRTHVLDIPVMSSQPFSISQHETVPGVLRVALSGEFDMGVGDSLSDALEQAARQPGVDRIVVDLAQARFIDSYTIATLLTGYTKAVAAQRSFTVVNPRGTVQRVLDVTGLSEVLCR
jgi:anti-anti-sigma factor